MRRFGPLPEALLVTLAACSAEPPTGPIVALPRPLTQAESQLVAIGNRFTFSLFRETLRQEPAAANVFVSPLSMAMALGMTYNGASGTTEAQMQQALELSGLSRDEINIGFHGLIELLRGLDRQATFTIANSIWYRNGFTFAPAFLEVNRTAFDAEIRGVDFASAQAPATINNWVNEKTGGRIPEIVPSPLPDDAIMYLVNAIYFKASWATRFDPARTTTQAFHLAGGGTSQVPMMAHGREVAVRRYGDGAVDVLDLPYGGGAFSMTIVLPRLGESLDSVVARLTLAAWDGWMAGLDSGQVEVYLPRFTLRYDLAAAIDVLKALGMPQAFCDSPTPPDFTRMYPAGGACISEVKHKTFVLVDEAGTEAAAATSVGIGVTSAPMPFLVDRPFLFVIRERFSGTILFIGRVMNPAA